MTDTLVNSEKPTFEQVWLMFQDTNKKFLETDKKFQETKEQLKETSRILDSKFLETKEQLKETSRILDSKFLETDKQIKELGKQIGGLHNKFGSFNEGLFMPSLKKLLSEHFECREQFENYTYKNNGDILEIDLLGISEKEAYLIEIKSHLRDDAIEQIKTEAEQFRRFSKYSKDRKIFCILASTHCKESERLKVIKEGIYFISVNDDIVKLKIPKNFNPTEW